jgi:hypothetical protein
MGNTASEPDEDDPSATDPFDGVDTLGYRVLGVQPDSPASQAGLVSFLDFLVGAQGRMLLGSGEDLADGEEYDDIDLPALLKEYQNKELELLVWNIKSQQERLICLTPRDDWGGAGLLGVTIRLDNYAGAEDRLIRVLTVEPQSPAAVAGLVPYQDFLLGTTHQTLETTTQLADLLQTNVDQVVEFYVYNVDSDLVRLVALLPTRAWGGGGLLGAQVGVGYLHRLPHAVRTTPGASVARKVRYVGVAPGGRAGTPRLPRPVLVMEPQLEMEAHDGEPEDDDEDSDHSDNVEEVFPPRRTPAPSNEQTAFEPLPLSNATKVSADTPDNQGGTLASAAASVFAAPPVHTSMPPAPQAEPCENHGLVAPKESTARSASNSGVFDALPPPPQRTAYRN